MLVSNEQMVHYSGSEQVYTRLPDEPSAVEPALAISARSRPQPVNPREKKGLISLGSRTGVSRPGVRHLKHLTNDYLTSSGNVAAIHIHVWLRSPYYDCNAE